MVEDARIPTNFEDPLHDTSDELTTRAEDWPRDDAESRRRSKTPARPAHRGHSGTHLRLRSGLQGRRVHSTMQSRSLHTHTERYEVRVWQGKPRHARPAETGAASLPDPPRL